jgi:Zn-dependent protease
MDFSIIQRIVIWALPILFAITVHEAAHGWVAAKLGDKSALMLGRVTLNPLKHIDPVGTIVVPLILLWLGGFIFGWAKPVPINPRNFKNPRKDMAITAAAGPLSNFIMALIWALIAKIGVAMVAHGWSFAIPIQLMGSAGIMINLLLMFLNLIPLPPLDGGRIVAGLLPHNLALQYDKLERFGILILLGLLVFGGLNFLLIPVTIFYRLILLIFGLG